MRNTSSKTKVTHNHDNAHTNAAAPSADVAIPTSVVTRQTLERVPARALQLLRAIGINLPIRAALESIGFTEEDRTEGWELLKRASGYQKSPGLQTGQFDAGVQKAIAALDAWDEDGFRTIRATLARRYPAQAAKVLDGLSPSTGPDAVIGVAMLLDRLDTMAASNDKTDRAATSLLSTRGITAEERKKLRAYVETAQSGGTVSAGPPPSETVAEEEDADHVKALTELRAWYEEWSALAKSVIKRRDRLILMGLAKRHANEASAPTPPTSSTAGTTTTGTTQPPVTTPAAVHAGSN